MVAPDEDAYLRAHVWGLLATSRANGAPQMSMVAYDWDGSDVAISCRSSAAKFVNAGRRPHVVFAVPDGVDNLTVTGRAVCHATGPERDRLTERVRDTFGPQDAWAAAILDREIGTGLDAARRVIIQIIPDSIELLRPRG